MRPSLPGFSAFSKPLDGIFGPSRFIPSDRIFCLFAFAMRGISSFAVLSAAQPRWTGARLSRSFEPPRASARRCSSIHFSPLLIGCPHIPQMPLCASNSLRRCVGVNGLRGVVPTSIQRDPMLSRKHVYQLDQVRHLFLCQIARPHPDRRKPAVYSRN